MEEPAAADQLTPQELEAETASSGGLCIQFISPPKAVFTSHQKAELNPSNHCLPSKKSKNSNKFSP